MLRVPGKKTEAVYPTISVLIHRHTNDLLWNSHCIISVIYCKNHFVSWLFPFSLFETESADVSLH